LEKKYLFKYINILKLSKIFSFIFQILMIKRIYIIILFIKDILF